MAPVTREGATFRQGGTQTSRRYHAKGDTMSTDTKVAPKKSAAKKTPATKKSDARVTLSSVYARYAAKRDIDTTRAAKLVRAKLRSNFAEVCKLDANVAKVKQSANDGNRWPTHITRKLSDFLGS